MENASQALIIAGAILIAIMVLSLGVYLVAKYIEVGESYGRIQVANEIEKFNANFTKFIARTDITAQEIVTLRNFAKSYDENNGTNTSVNCQGLNDNTVEFIQENAPDGDPLQFRYFTCNEANIKYDENGRVKEITFIATI